MDKLYIVIPAYNEEKNIESLIKDWYSIIETHNGDGESRLVVIDDGSKDGTYELLKKIAEDKPLLMPLTKQNEGHGPTLLHGYRYAIDKGADYIFQTDSDGQTNPAEFEAFWECRKDYDAIFGNRVVRGDGQIRAFVERVLSLLLRMYYGVKVPDANAPFRLMSAEYVSKHIQRMPEKYNLPNVMLTAFGAYYKDKIKFVEISFKPRQAGSNSINIKKIIGIGWQSLHDFREIKRGL